MNNRAIRRRFAGNKAYIYRIKSESMAHYIYQEANWPHITWDSELILPLLGQVRQLQGRLFGQMQWVGFEVKAQAQLATFTADVVQSSAIEGEHLNPEAVRSSIAQQLGMPEAGLKGINRHIEGVVQMTLDATQNYDQALTESRLCGWHAALFPTGYSGMHAIEVGRYRSGRMQIVSGPLHRHWVHYEAIPPAQVASEMRTLLNWLNDDCATQQLDPVLKAAIAHFWFIIIHPFDDGNGRIARALTDLLLARSDGSSDRFYSMSSQILAEKKQYYKVLQAAQHSSGDITEWLMWFLNCLQRSLLLSAQQLERVMQKAHFWMFHDQTPMNERQRLVLNKLLGDFEGKMQSAKWAKMAKCSADTALRDIKDLVEKGVLRQEAGGGRSTHYAVCLPTPQR